MKNDDVMDLTVVFCILFVFVLVLYCFCVATELFSVNKGIYNTRVSLYRAVVDRGARYAAVTSLGR